MVTEIISFFKNKGGGDFSLNCKYHIDNWPIESFGGSEHEIANEDEEDNNFERSDDELNPQ